MRSLKTDSLFKEELTADGSPTLRLNEGFNGESMHNAVGAASETIYIYGEAILRAQKRLDLASLNYFILGLGVGYIEILIALMTQFKFSKMVSFEKQSSLRTQFQNWLTTEDEFIQDRAYESLINLLKLKLDKKSFKQQFQAALTEQRVEINPEFKLDVTAAQEKYQVICYDAFSKKTDEYLWNYDFLDHFIKKYCDSTCIFSSYAKTGDLSRALKNNGFEIQSRSGFGGKRDSTLAIRQ